MRGPPATTRTPKRRAARHRAMACGRTTRRDPPDRLIDNSGRYMLVAGLRTAGTGARGTIPSADADRAGRPTADGIVSREGERDERSLVGPGGDAPRPMGTPTEHDRRFSSRRVLPTAVGTALPPPAPRCARAAPPAGPPPPPGPPAALPPPP